MAGRSTAHPDQAAAVAARRRWLVKLLAMAADNYPRAGWDRLVRVACQIGSRSPGGAPDPAEYAAISGMTIADLFGNLR